MKFARLIPLALPLLLAGCGSDSDDNKDDSAPVDAKPVAEAGADQSLASGSSLLLTGKASDDKAGFKVQWTLVSGPALLLEGADTVNLKVTAPSLERAAAAVLRLTVTDSAGQTATDELTLTVSARDSGDGGDGAPDAKPVVNAGADRIESGGKTITLNGQISDDKAGSRAAWTQVSGTPTLALGSADSASLPVSLPAVSAPSDIVLRLTATDSAGQTASDDVEISIMPAPQSFTISGKTAFKPLAKATIVARIGEQTTATVTADSNGLFSLPVAIEGGQGDQVIELQASGAGSQAKLVLSSVLGSVDSALQAAGSDTVLSADEVPAVNLSQLTTARSVLLAQANNAKVPASQAELIAAEARLDPDALLDMAAVYTLLAEDTPYPLPPLYDDVPALLRDRASYDAFLAMLQRDNPTTLDGARKATLTDAAPLASVKALPSLAIRSYAALDGFQSPQGAGYRFNADQSGQLLLPYGRADFTWNKTASGYQLTFSKAPVFTVTEYVNDGMKQSLGLNDSQLTALADSAPDGVSVAYTRVSATLQLLSDGYSVDSYRLTEQDSRQLLPTRLKDGSTLTGQPVPFSYATENAVLRNADKPLHTPFDPAMLNGQWALDTFRTVKLLDLDKGASPEPRATADHYLDRLNFQADGSGSVADSTRSFTWTVNAEGHLLISYNDGQTQQLRLLDARDGLFGIYSETHQAGQPLAAQFSIGLKTEPGDFKDNIQINAPGQYWQSFLEAWQPAIWTLPNGVMDPLTAPYLGFQFSAEGQGFRAGHFGGDWAFEGEIFKPETTDSTRWSVATDGTLNTTITNTDNCSASEACHYRNWRLLKKIPGHVGSERLIVLEQDWGRQAVNDAYSQHIGPRLNQYERLDFAYWNGKGPLLGGPAPAKSAVRAASTRLRQAEHRAIR